MPTADESFAAAYAQHLRAVSAYLNRRVDRSFVEDLAADVFAIAWSKRQQVAAGEELPWLYRIAANVIANHRRRQLSAASFLASFRPVETAPSAEDIVVADHVLANAWKQLRPRDREVLALALLEDLPVANIALALGISPNAASIRLHRARKVLGELLSEVPTTSSERLTLRQT